MLTALFYVTFFACCLAQWRNDIIYSDASCSAQVGLRVSAVTCTISALGPCTVAGNGFTRTSCTAAPGTDKGPVNGPAMGTYRVCSIRLVLKRCRSLYRQHLQHAELVYSIEHQRMCLGCTHIFSASVRRVHFYVDGSSLGTQLQLRWNAFPNIDKSIEL